MTTTTAAWDAYKSTMRAPANLYDMARSGDVAGTRALLELGIDINDKNQKGHSALMLAAYHANYKLCEFLIENGADVNSIDGASNTILMGVAFKGHLEIAGLLIRNGADIRYRNEKGQNALDFAQMFGRSEMVKFLKREQGLAARYNAMDFLKGWISYFKGARS